MEHFFSALFQITLQRHSECAILKLMPKAKNKYILAFHHLELLFLSESNLVRTKLFRLRLNCIDV